MVGCAAHRMMELDADGRRGSGYGERSAEYMNQRNGHRDREWRTRTDTIELLIPKEHQG